MDIKTIISKVVGKMTIRKSKDIESSVHNDPLLQSTTVTTPSTTTGAGLQLHANGIPVWTNPWPTTLTGVITVPGTVQTSMANMNSGTHAVNSSYVTGSYNTTIGGFGGAGYSAISGGSGGYSTSNSNVIFHGGANHKEIVRLNADGSVTWADGINVPEASQAFERSLRLGAERSAGITYGVKQRIRDAVFEELIDMANAKGTLSIDDLTYLHQAAKIMDKLRGIKE